MEDEGEMSEDYNYYINKEYNISNDIAYTAYVEVKNYPFRVFQFKISFGRPLNDNDPYVLMTIKFPLPFPGCPFVLGFDEFYKNTEEEINHFIIKAGELYKKIQKEWTKDYSIPKTLILLRDLYCSMYKSKESLSIDREMLMPQIITQNHKCHLLKANGFEVSQMVLFGMDESKDLSTKNKKKNCGVRTNATQDTVVIYKQYKTPEEEEEINKDLEFSCSACYRTISKNFSIELGYIINYKNKAITIEKGLYCTLDYMKKYEKNKECFWIPFYYSLDHLMRGLLLINKENIYSLFCVSSNNVSFSDPFWIKFYAMILEEIMNQIIEKFKKEKKLSEFLIKTFVQLYIVYCSFVQLYFKQITLNFKQIETIIKDYFSKEQYIRALLLLSSIDKEFVKLYNFIQLIVINLIKKSCVSNEFHNFLIKLYEKNINEIQKEKEKTPMGINSTPSSITIEELDSDFFERFEYWNEYFAIIKDNYIIKPKNVVSDGSRRNIRSQEVPFLEKIRRVMKGIEEKTILYSEVEKDKIEELVNLHYVKTDQGIIPNESLDEYKRLNDIIDNDNKNIPLPSLLNKCLIYHEDIIQYIYDSTISDKSLLYVFRLYSKFFGDKEFIEKAKENKGYITEEQNGLILSILFYVDSISTIKEGINMLSNNTEYKPEELIFLIQKSIGN